MIFGLIALFLGSVASFAVPGLLGIVVDAMLANDEEKIRDYCLYMLIICVVSGISSGMRGAIFNMMSYKIARDIKYDLFWYLVRKDVTFFDEKKTGDILSRISSDVAVLQDGLSTNVSMFVRALVFIVISIVILCVLSWKLTLVALGGIFTTSLVLICFFKRMAKLGKEIQDAKAEIGEVSEEAMSNIRTVKAFANEFNEIEKFRAKNEKAYAKGYDLAVVVGFFTWWITISINSVNAAIIYYGSVLYNDDEISLGEITSFLLYMIQLIFNFMMLSGVVANLVKISGASQKMVEYMKYVPDVNAEGGKAMAEEEVQGVIELKDVTFCYPTKKEVKVCSKINLKVHKNQVVALVGKSGSGKSSIINLIERFYDVSEGEILFDGVNIKELNPQWYKQQIAIVSQEPVLFSTSIRDNIVYGLPEEEVTEEMLEDACRKANCLKFIQDKGQFPQGFDTLVGERGVKLSGGQKQRVAIARALIRKPKLLLLDEATSALDAESEHLVQQAIDELIQSGQQTVICIAHRLSTIKDANVIAVMKDGELVERGTHQELLGQDGVYKKLIERQLQNQNQSSSARRKEEDESD